MFLVITKTNIIYSETAEAAAKAAGSPAYGWAKPAYAIGQLGLGDELELDTHTSVICLSGKEITYEGIDPFTAPSKVS